MQPIPLTISNGQQLKENYNPYSGYFSRYAASPSRRLGLTCAPIVRGNFKSPNPFSYTYQRSNLLNGSTRNATNWGAWSKDSGPINFDSADPMLLSETFPSDLYNRTLSKLYERLRGEIDLAVDIAQAGQTTRMLRDAKKLESYCFGLNWRDIARKSAAARLVYVYGIKPLASTLYESVERSLDVLEKNFLLVEAKCSDPVSPSRNVTFTVAGPGSVNGIAAYKGRYVCQLKCSYRTKGSSIDTWTSLNPVSIAWELVPYSFVVDWFLNIGNYIRDFETSLLYANSFTGGFMTQGIFYDANCDVRHYTGNSTSNWTTVGSASTNFRKLTRTVLSATPTPEMPSFKADLGSSRLLNAAALLAQFISKAK